MAVLGPRDRRKLRTRCIACTRRKIKCEEGPPCLYCTKKGQKCVPQLQPERSGAVFVSTSTSGKNIGHLSLVQNSLPRICSKVPQDKPSLFVKHFFSTFLVRNDFGGALDLDTIISQFQSSPCLYQASIAVGALDLSRNFSLPSNSKASEARVEALTAYRLSIRDFQDNIGSNGVQQSNASLWTTFFLGIFELMYDNTGEGFVKHFLYGTSRMLQLRGPDAHLTGAGRSFFLTVRVFEICRSLIYSEPTFLVQEDWKSLVERIWREDTGEGWHPKEALLDLMVECSALSHRVWDVLRPGAEFPVAILDNKLLQLAGDGHLLREALDDWYTSFRQFAQTMPNSVSDPQSLLATIYYHATSIYLSGIFDYRHQFTHIATPSLPQAIIQQHVDSILSSTEIALKNTNLGGVLFFFPLRVAGARATSRGEAERIVGMLNEISGRSFVVADAFVSDLSELWQSKAIY